MRERGKTRSIRWAAFLSVGSIALAAGCGGEDFKNEPRPPVPIDLTGVIQSSKVTVSPNHVGAGPIIITISNQTNDPHTVTLAGEPRNGNRVSELVGPINPLDTATIQKTLAPGTYQVRAGSEVAVRREIRPATLTVGRSRGDSNNRVLVP